VVVERIEVPFRLLLKEKKMKMPSRLIPNHGPFCSSLGLSTTSRNLLVIFSRILKSGAVITREVGVGVGVGVGEYLSESYLTMWEPVNSFHGGYQLNFSIRVLKRY
jgi:hypothetical protein